MKVTVRECLELAAFDRAKVLAAKNNLGATVRKVSIMDANEAKDVARYCGGKEQIVLTSFFGIKADEDAQCRAIEALVEKKASALVIFHVGKVVKKISRKVINTAERNGLPLIALDPDLKLDVGDVIEEIMGKLLVGDDFGNSLISNTVFHLLNFERYSGFPEAAKAAALSNDFQLILLSSDFNPVLTVETRYRTTIAEAIRLGKERDLEKSSATTYTMIDVNGVLTYWGPVTIQGKKHFMFIVDNEDFYSPSEITKLAEIIELAMGMWKYTPKRDSKAELIKALRRGNVTLAYSLKDHAGVDPEQIATVFYGKGMTEGKGRKALESLDAEEELTVMSLEEDGESYGLIMTTGDKKEAGAKCVEAFEQLKGGKDAMIYYVATVNGLEGAGDAYRLINETGHFANTVFPLKRVFTKYELSLISNCINIQLQGGSVKRVFDEIMEPFDEYGNKGRQLLETLLVFVLDAGMNSAKAAGLMDVHNNTIQYRLKKIYDILGAEITGNRVIPGLTIALVLRRLEMNEKE